MYIYNALGRHISDFRLVASAVTTMRNQGDGKILCWGELLEIRWLWIYVKLEG